MFQTVPEYSDFIRYGCTCVYVLNKARMNMLQIFLFPCSGLTSSTLHVDVDCALVGEVLQLFLYSTSTVNSA